MYILNCEAFNGELSARYSNKCCQGDCHVNKTLINVTPWAVDATLENRRLDWSLGIQGYVCCGRYEFVRSLSREWWVRRLAVIDNWSEDKVRQFLTQGSWHRVYDDAKGKSVKASIPKLKSRPIHEVNCPQCGSTWNQTICEECGHNG